MISVELIFRYFLVSFSSRYLVAPSGEISAKHCSNPKKEPVALKLRKHISKGPTLIRQISS